MLNVEVIYVDSNKAIIQKHCLVPIGSTVADALNISHIMIDHPEACNREIGIFSRRANMDTVLQQGDRIEIYRSLTADPKDKRRQKANAAKIKHRI